MGLIRVRASRRARAHTRSTIARQKKTHALLRKVDARRRQPGSNKRMGQLASLSGKLNASFRTMGDILRGKALNAQRKGLTTMYDRGVSRQKLHMSKLKHDRRLTDLLSRY